MVYGTLQGGVVVFNPETNVVTAQHLGDPNHSVLGLCWLNRESSKFLAGSDNGTIRLFDIDRMISGENGGVVCEFPPFSSLTSVHANCTDTIAISSGYASDVAVYDLQTGKMIDRLPQLHTQHINVIKFAGGDPNLFATSSFDRSIKLWDLRQRATPIFSFLSNNGNVMVCFSPDDRFLLSSAVDNEVREICVPDGRVHVTFDIQKRGSRQNYTRSYYMNGGDYVITGSCQESVVRIYNALTGQYHSEVNYSSPDHGDTLIYCQSLRGDPFHPFHFSVLLCTAPALHSPHIVRTNLLRSVEDGA
jgi:WD40 repeat protein